MKYMECMHDELGPVHAVTMLMLIVKTKPVL